MKSSSNSDNIYDIICYYNDDDNDEPKHAMEVIHKIEKTNRSLKRDSWIKWKLFGCLIINVLLSAPIYSYGTFYLLHKPIFDVQPILIWPPIIFNSVSLIVTPWLFNTIQTSTSRCSRAPRKNSSIFSKMSNKTVIIIFSLILSMGVSISGFSFSYLNANALVILICYSFIGGITSCIVMGKLFVLINGILNNNRLHMINFLYSFGQALAQFMFPYLIQLQTKFIYYNSLLVIGACMLHIIPLTMIVAKSEILIKLRHQQTLKSFINNNPNEESRYSDISDISFDFCTDIKYPSDIFDMENNKWKNQSSSGSYAQGDNFDNFLQELDSHRIMNSEGVEILQTILEADEEVEIKFPEKINVEDKELTDDTIESIYEEIGRKHAEHQHENNKPNNCSSFMKKIFVKKHHKISTTFHRQIVNPLRRSLTIFKFYPSVILKSCDIFSYLLFITLILPNLALKQYRFEDRGKVIYLTMLMSLAWISYAILILKFHDRLKQNCMQYFHIAGLLGKFFGYLFTNQRYSFNGFIFGLLLISLGHANSFHLQEIMIRNCFHPRKWNLVRGSVYSFSGFLILIYCIIFHFLHLKLSFVTFCNIFVLFNLSGILVWLLTHYKSIIYIFNQY